jgi:adenylate cyclase, class 2
MNHEGKEIEVKFFVYDLAALETRLQNLGARLVQPRQHELNLRFDTPNRKLSKEHKALRLRKDNQTKMTYKGPGELHEGARLRQELEFSVSDFETAQQFFEELGYEVTIMYEKYRAAYSYGIVEVTLDELPYGNFAEIEGPTGAHIQTAAEHLELEWEARILDSYLALHNQARKHMKFSFRDLSFENFTGLEVRPSDLGIRYGDTFLR